MKKFKKLRSPIAFLMVFCMFMMSCPSGVLAEEIKSVDTQSVASTDINYDGIYEESLAIADLFDSIGIDANTLVTILNLTPKDTEFYEAPYVEPNPEIAAYFENADIVPFEPLDEYQVRPLDGDPYDGNPPYTEEEQQQRLEYIKGVFNREYSAERYQPIQGRYLAYLYTSHYIENINFDRTKSPSENFNPVFANIIGSADIEAFDTFYRTQQNAAILQSFTSIGSMFTSIESSGLEMTALVEVLKLQKTLLGDEIEKLLSEFSELGIVDTTTIKETMMTMSRAFIDNYDTVENEEQLIALINNQIGDLGLSGLLAKNYVNTMKIAVSSGLGSTIVAPVIGGVLLLFDQLSSTISTTALGGLYYSYPTRKQLRLAIYYGVSQRP
ncbi:hypothetical protein [Eubacterium limosum]|uniref:hypothetical protein n=1 Tax=Eubacterium limosum TaxID=1736 RepID=UPI00372175DB